MMTDHLINVITVKDFDKICRTCLGFGKVSSIFQASVEDVKAPDLLEYSVKIQVAESDLKPQNICDGCLINLYRMYEFKNQCQENEALLQSLVLNSQKDTKTEFTDDSCSEEVDLKEDEIQIITQEQARQYSCRTCLEIYPTQEDLKKHQMELNHISGRPNQCEVCGVHVVNIHNHMRRHTKDKPFKCDICLKCFSFKRNLQRHNMTHTGERPHVCALCGKGFIQAVTLKEHKRRHTKWGGVQKLDCNYCGRHFKRQNAFNYHVQRHKDKTFEGPVTLNREKERQYQCQICSATFQTKTGLHYHSNIHNDKKFLCNFCGKALPTRSALISHSMTHSEDRPHTCLICKKSFKRDTALNSHVMSHTGERPYKCRYCMQAFRQSAHLHHHERTHTGEKPYICPFCEKGFATSGNLQVHVRTHTGERPYVCPVCGRGFHDSTNMKRHRRKAHVKTEEEDKVETVGVVGSESDFMKTEIVTLRLG